MRGAGSANALNLGSERLARTVDPNAGVICGDTSLLGQFTERLLLQIDYLDCIAVLGLEFGDDVFEAFADFPAGEIVRIDLRFEVLGPLLDGAISGSLVAIVVDYRVAKDTVEPGDGGLVVAKFAAALQTADVGSLQDVLGDRTGPDTALDEGEELASMVDEALEHVCGKSLGHEMFSKGL